MMKASWMGVEDAVVAKLLAQGRHTEHASKAPPDVLPVKQGLGVVLHDLLHGVKGAVHHQRDFAIGRVPLPCFFGDFCGGVAVSEEVVHVRFFRSLGLVEGFLHRGCDFSIQKLQGRLVGASRQHFGFELWQGVALGGLLQVVSVEFPTNAARVVPQEGDRGVDHEGTAFLAGRLNCVGHGLVACLPVRAIHRQHLDAREGLGEGRGVAKANLRRVGADVPLVVLNKPNHGELLQRRHVERLGNLAFRHCRVANGAKPDAWQALHAGNPCGLAVFHGFRGQPDLLQVLQPHGRAGSRDGLHARRGALVGDLGLTWAVQAGMAVVGAPARKRIVFFGKQLKHQLLGGHAHRHQQAVVAVVATHVILGEQLAARRNLDDLVAS